VHAETVLKAIAPDRDDRIIAVECLFPWYGLADLCAREGRPCGLGHALSMKAIQGGTAQHDTSDAYNMAVPRRGGRRLQASVDPAAMRATHDL
jgi:hypothetical protein